MKKLLLILLSGLMLFSFTGCGDDNEMVEIAKKAIEITDDYLDTNLTSLEAMDKLEVLHGRAEIEAEKYKTSGESEVLEIYSDLIVWNIEHIKTYIEESSVVEAKEEKEDLESHLETFEKYLEE